MFSAVVVPRPDWTGLRALPWGHTLEEWPEHGVTPLSIRRGESRHPVQFVEAGRRRYAIKETSPLAAQHEIRTLSELRQRGCRTLEPVGYVVTRGEPLIVGEIAGRPAYESGDTGYCITRLAEHVLPQSILYRYPFTDANKRLLWNAVAELLLTLHESGAYWGDPSLANVLIALGGFQLVAVMADAETAQLVPGPLDEGLRRQDLDAFIESLEWQAEDIRLARALPEDEHLVTQGDAEYFLSRYEGLRSERRAAHETETPAGLAARLEAFERRVRRLNMLGYGILDVGSRALRSGWESIEATWLPPLGTDLQVGTVRPGWYVRRLRALLGMRAPRVEAQRIYQHILVHKWLMSERHGEDVGMAAATRDWVEQVHRPLLAFLDAYLPEADDATRYRVYANILDFTWQMSQREHRSIAIEEGALAYALAGGGEVQASSEAADDEHLGEPAGPGTP